MTWEETIAWIRTQPDYRSLVEQAYLEADLPLNIERFRASDEWKQTLAWLKQYAPDAKSILDVGSGNGVSAVSFALEGYRVTAIEPDPSPTVGAGAIRELAVHYALENLQVMESFAEEMPKDLGPFDVVYARQCMHHAHQLNAFVANMAGLLRPNGLFLTVRDHVITDASDKQWFLEKHPLQQYYGGENAFTDSEYRKAIQDAGLALQQVVRFFDNVVNYAPLTEQDIAGIVAQKQNHAHRTFRQRWHPLSRIPGYMQFLYRKPKCMPDESEIPGRMYSYIALKP